MNAYVFDFDGPLFEGRAAAAKALAATADRFADECGRPSLLFDQLPLLPPRPLLTLLYSEEEKAAPGLEKIEAFYREQLEIAETGTGIRPEIRALLRRLREDGCKIAILSSRRKANLVARLRQLGIEKLIELVHGRDSLAHAKPSPEALRQIARELCCSVSGLVMIGDSESDYCCAREAGAVYYHITWSGEPNQLAVRNAAAVFTTPADLVDALSIRMTSSVESGPMPTDLMEGIGERDICFYAGSGVSVPSGIGDWSGHYTEVLRSLGAGFLIEDGGDLPGLLQLLVAQRRASKRVFELFKRSFDRPDLAPNAYHYAMLRAQPTRVWTSNYDALFEKANVLCGFGYQVATDDATLLEQFRSRQLVVKMNGDFASATYSEELDWNLVFTQEQFDLVERNRPEVWRLFEDDYRNRCLVFVGVSFRDAALHRIVSIARQKIPKTRYNHYLLAKRSAVPVEAWKDELQAENLRRQSIHTLFFPDFESIERFVARLAIARRNPIIGFSGSFRGLESAADSEIRASTARLPGGGLTPAQVADFGSQLGEALAERGYRVTSGCSPVVGIPPVSAAFRCAPTRARFYLRARGGAKYAGTAPAIVVPGSDLEAGDVYGAMRRRFISELNLLVAYGGSAHASGSISGVVVEIEMAMACGIPVLIIPQVGGAAAAYHTAFLQGIDRFYKDPALAGAIRALNEAVAEIAADALVGYVRDEMIEHIESLMVHVARCSVSVGRCEANGTDW